MLNFDYHFICIVFLISRADLMNSLLRKRSTSLKKRIFLPLNVDLKYEINDNYWGWIPFEIQESGSEPNSPFIDKRSLDDYGNLYMNGGVLPCDKDNATIEPDVIYENEAEEDDEGQVGNAHVQESSSAVSLKPPTTTASSSREQTQSSIGDAHVQESNSAESFKPTTTASSTREQTESSTTVTTLNASPTTMPTKAYEGRDCSSATTIEIPSSESTTMEPFKHATLIEDEPIDEACNEELTTCTSLLPDIETPPYPLPDLDLSFMNCSKQHSEPLPVKSVEIGTSVCIERRPSLTTSSYERAEITQKASTTMKTPRTTNALTTKWKSSAKSTTEKLTTKRSFLNKLFGLDGATTEMASVAQASTYPHFAETKLNTISLSDTTEETNDKQSHTTQGTDVKQIHTTEGTDIKHVHTTEGTDIKPIHTTEGTDIKPINTTEGTNIKYINTTERTDINTTEGTDVKQIHITEGTDVKYINTTEGTDIKHVHTTKGTGIKHTHTTEGTDIKHVHTTKRTGTKRIHTTEGTDIKYINTTEGTDIKHINTTEGTDIKYINTTEGTDIKPIHTTKRTGTKRIHTTKRTGTKRIHTTKGTGIKPINTTEGTDIKPIHTTKRTGTKRIHTTKGTSTKQNSENLSSASTSTTTEATSMSTSESGFKESTSSKVRISNHDNKINESVTKLAFNRIYQNNDESIMLGELNETDEGHIGQVIVRIPSSLGDIPVIVLKDPKIPELTMSVVPVQRYSPYNYTKKPDISNVRHNFLNRNIYRKVPSSGHDYPTYSSSPSIYQGKPNPNINPDNYLLSLPFKFTGHNHMKWKTPLINLRKRRNINKENL